MKNVPNPTIECDLLRSRLVSFFQSLRPALGGGVILLSCLLLTAQVSADETTPGQNAIAQPAPQPTAKIDLSQFGYQGLGEMARLASQANVSVDFVDRNHVLLTFNPKKLFKRLPDCPPTHDDRIIHAVILEVPSGKVVRQADWYMHDGHRYLWALGYGRFLLRRLNSLSIVDSDLHEKPLMASPKEFLWLAVTPDGKQILVETARDESPSKKKDSSATAPKQRVKIDFLDIDSLAVQRTIKSEGIVNLEATSTGFTDVSHGMSGKVWLVRFGPTAQTRENIARVRSRCIPDTFYPSSNTVLIGRCSATGSDYSVSAFTVTGHRLWRQRWSRHRYVPKIARSDDGSRFALSTLQRSVPGVSAKTGSDEDEDIASPEIEQHIQIFDTATGTPVLSVDTSPVVLTAQNFSFAPDGSRLVMLQQSSLQVYDLPAMSADERSKYTAVRADVPGLYMPASEPTLSMASDASGTKNEDSDDFGAAEAVKGPDEDQAKPSGSQPAEAKTEAAAKSPVPPESAADNKNDKKDSADAVIPTFKSSAHVVVVDVVVTDRKGHTVAGLQQKDFQVAEDGKQQSVGSFDEIKTQPTGAKMPDASGAAPSASDIAAAAPPKLPLNIYTNNSPAPESHSSTIILLDLLNTPLADQQQARQQLIDFLKKKPEASQMALCALSTRLRLIQGFTRDENLLMAGVNGKKGGVKAPPFQSDSGLDMSAKLARDLWEVNGDALSRDLMQRAQNAVDEQKAQDAGVRMRTTVDAFEQLARYLSGIPGRKNLVWLSGSFPLNIFPNPDVTDYEPVTRDFTAEIKWATNLLAEAHVAVYPVSVKGLETQTYYEAGNNGDYTPRQLPGSQGAGNPGLNLLLNTSVTQPMSSRIDQETREFRNATASEQGTMLQVASDTGGKAFFNTNGLEAAIETAVDQGSHYYSFSYTPSNKNYDGRFRKIKVSFQQKGYQLTYRRGYYAMNPRALPKNDASHRIGVAAMQQGSPQSHQIVFSSRVVPLGKPRKVDSAQLQLAVKKKSGLSGPVEMQHYGIDYAVDPSSLMFVPDSAGLFHGTLNFMVTAFNDDGRLMASLASTAVSDLKPANYKDVMTGGFRLHQELDVPVDAVSIRLGVEDEMTNHIGTLEIPLPVPVPPDVPRVMARSLPEIEPD
jgi:VWFA-related protein